MATYPRLLLTAGGGIISRTQQADQVKNTASKKSRNPYMKGSNQTILQLFIHHIVIFSS